MSFSVLSSLSLQNKFSLTYTLLHQMVCTKLAAIFTRHGVCERKRADTLFYCTLPVPVWIYSCGVWCSLCLLTGASLLQPPLLCPRSSHLYSGPHSIPPQFIERNGAVVTLPSDHRLPLAHYLLHQQDVNYLKRYIQSKTSLP